ncbi:hypothetical protein Leryth_011702 [Lithospermum erythrorhizon]|nr:hypothetical protein Leryth_011702 [Lithospermum erythrorhizon]
MASLYFVTICILSLALFVTSLDGRMVPGDRSLESVKHKHSLVTEAIGDDVINVDLILPLSENKKTDCTETKEFEPRPSVSAYDNELRLEGENKSFLKDFEPRPSATTYKNDEAEKSLTSTKDFNPRSNISIYIDEIEVKGKNKSFLNDFEPRPSATAYKNDVGMNEYTSFSNDFEQRPVPAAAIS